MRNSYYLEKNVYYQTVWFIRGHEDRKAKYESLFFPSGGDGPRGSDISDPTGTMALNRGGLELDIAAVAEALDRIPHAYQSGIYLSITERKRFPDYAGTKTWKHWKRRFIYYVAVNKGWHI